MMHATYYIGKWDNHAQLPEGHPKTRDPMFSSGLGINLGELKSGWVEVSQSGWSLDNLTLSFNKIEDLITFSHEVDGLIRAWEEKRQELCPEPEEDPEDEYESQEGPTAAGRGDRF